jgi:hypothetical protein
MPRTDKRSKRISAQPCPDNDKPAACGAGDEVPEVIEEGLGPVTPDKTASAATAERVFWKIIVPPRIIKA